MNIVIFGASGRVGRLVVIEALAAGHQVTAFVHNHNPFEAEDKLRIVQGSIDDASAVATALAGSEAVICTLGSWKTKQKNVVSRGVQNILTGMGATNTRRIILLTGSGAYWSGDKLSMYDRLSHVLLLCIAPRILRDGEAAIATLEHSQTDWTIIRSPGMKSSGKPAYALSTRIGSPLSMVSRASVAAAVVDQLNETAWLQQAPVIHST